MALKQTTEINILLLGETGVGKSTFINAFANYINYETLDEAIKSESICIIPVKFSLSDENYEEKVVKYGQDKNENHKNVGQSVTQNCISYCFKHGDKLIRIIDTPGIGDTRGLEHDKINFAKMLKFIAEYKELQLICILMLPNKNKLTPSFNYCIKQLFCHLEKTAGKNIVFLFTNARATFYKPQGTLPLLKQIVAEINQDQNDVVLTISKHTMYCLDNDSFQFLIAIKNEIKFDDDEMDDYRQSWLKSVKECKRMMSYTTHGANGQPLPPHAVQNTLSVNETRRLIVTLEQPIASITETIGITLININNIEKLFDKSNSDITTIMDNMKKYNYEFKYSKIDYIPVVNFITLTYKKIKAITSKKERDKLFKELTDVKLESGKYESDFNDLRQKKENLNNERNVILKASAKFALFLKKHAIATYNDSYKVYLLERINAEKLAKKSELEMQQATDMLNKILEDYEIEKNVLEKAINESNKITSDVSIGHINDLIIDLYNLKETGENIRKLHKKSKKTQGEFLKREFEFIFSTNQALPFFKCLAD